MSLNWKNFDRLTQHLQTMDPALFHYGISTRGDAREWGCVACHCAYLHRGEETGGYITDVQDFLGVTRDEARYLWGSESDAGNMRGPFMITTGPEAKAERGIREALRRLAVVAARYQRPVASEPESVAVVPDEAAFLAACDAVVRQPVRQDE